MLIFTGHIRYAVSLSYIHRLNFCLFFARTMSFGCKFRVCRLLRSNCWLWPNIHFSLALEFQTFKFKIVIWHIFLSPFEFCEKKTGGGGNVSPLAISDPPVLKFYYILVCILVATHKTKVQTKQFQNFLIALIIAYFMRKRRNKYPHRKWSI